MDSTAGSGIAAPAAAAVCDLRMEPKIPEPFVWPNGDARPASAAELDMPVVDVGVLRDGDAEGCAAPRRRWLPRAPRTGSSRCPGTASTRSGARALDGASDFFRLPLAEKRRARRVPGTVSGYTSAHADRFASKLPWKETLSFGFHDRAAAPVVADYFSSTLGPDFAPMG